LPRDAIGKRAGGVGRYGAYFFRPALRRIDGLLNANARGAQSVFNTSGAKALRRYHPQFTLLEFLDSIARVSYKASNRLL
jgi:hypothetical protein